MHDTFASDDKISVLAVQVDAKGDPNYLESNGYTFPNVRPGGDVARAFAVSKIPAFYVIDRDGRIIFEHMGLMDVGVRSTVERVAREARDG